MLLTAAVLCLSCTKEDTGSASNNSNNAASNGSNNGGSGGGGPATTGKRLVKITEMDTTISYENDIAIDTEYSTRQTMIEWGSDGRLQQFGRYRVAYDNAGRINRVYTGEGSGDMSYECFYDDNNRLYEIHSTEIGYSETPSIGQIEYDEQGNPHTFRIGSRNLLIITWNDGNIQSYNTRNGDPNSEYTFTYDNKKSCYIAIPRNFVIATFGEETGLKVMSRNNPITSTERDHNDNLVPYTLHYEYDGEYPISCRRPEKFTGESHTSGSDGMHVVIEKTHGTTYFEYADGTGRR